MKGHPTRVPFFCALTPCIMLNLGAKRRARMRRRHGLTNADCSMEATVDYPCMECGTTWSSLSAADGCATICAAADRAARHEPRGHDNNIVRSYD